MDNSNWRPIQGSEPLVMDTVDWRTELQPESRQRIVNKIMDTIKKHLLFSGPEELDELKESAEKFEEKTYSAATSQSDYLRKISLKMLNMETNSQNTVPNPMPNNQVGSSNRPPHQGVIQTLAVMPQQQQQQQQPPSSMMQPSLTGLQLASMNPMSSQNNGMNSMQQNMNAIQQTNPVMLQHAQIKQEQQQIMQSQQFKQQYRQRQLQQQEQAKQIPGQLPAHQSQIMQNQQMHPMNDVKNEMKMRQQTMDVKPNVMQQQHSATYPMNHHQQQQQQMKSGSPFSMASSPQLLQHPSPQPNQQSLLSSTLPKARTPLQSGSSPFVIPSPSTPRAPSPTLRDSEKPVPGVSSLSNVASQKSNGVGFGVIAAPPAQSLAIGIPGISASPLLTQLSDPDETNGNELAAVSGKSSATEQPLDRLMKAVKSMSSKALTASVSDIGSVVSMMDRIAGSAPGNGSRAAVGEDLVAMTKCRLQVRNFMTQDGTNGTRKMKRYTSAMPLNVVSSTNSCNDSFKQLSGSEMSDLESTATSSFKRPKLQGNQPLLDEIREINQRLIDTVVDISDEHVDPSTAFGAVDGGEGTIVKCSFIAVALSPDLKARYDSARMSPIQPLRLLVPTNYPNSSPVLLDKFPVEVSKEYEDLSAKAKSRFNISLRSLSQPMSLGAIARTWDVCARAVISEHAQKSGGGSFSSKHGSWETYVRAN